MTAPANLISSRPASHKSAEGWIYYDMAKTALEKDGYQVDIETSDNIIEDYSEYDMLMLYHGNDFGGSLNLFGGLSNVGVPAQLNKISKFRTFNDQGLAIKKIYSWKIPMPDYGLLVYNRIKSKSGYPEIWDEIDLAELTKLSEDVLDPILPYDNYNSKKLVIGDSHAICMYRAGWAVNSVPFQTLNGALTIGLDTFIDEDENYEKLEFYFGNIDIRHHVCRLGETIDEMAAIARKLAKDYVEAVESMDCDDVSIYVPLPIENESRVVPKSGFYKGKPFWGTWHQRNYIREIFIYQLKTQATRVKILEWTDYLLNSSGELDFAFMEKPRSVHLSREFYPHWTGKLEVITEAEGLF